MSNYDVLVQPDDRYWYVQVPAIERSTQAKGLDDIEPMAKDLITVMNDDDNPELKVTFVLPKQAKQHVTEMFRQRETGKKANAQKRLPDPTLATGPPTHNGDSRIDKSELYWGSPTNGAFQLVNGKTKAQNDSVRNRLMPTTESRSPRTKPNAHRYRLRSRLSERVHKAQTVSIPGLKSTEQNLCPSRLRRSSR